MGAPHLRSWPLPGAARPWAIALTLLVGAPAGAVAQGPGRPDGGAPPAEPDGPVQASPEPAPDPGEDEAPAEGAEEPPDTPGSPVEAPASDGPEGPEASEGPAEAGAGPSEEAGSPAEAAEREAPPEASGPSGSRPTRLSSAAPEKIRYFVERIEVTGNRRTNSRVVKHFVPLERGDVLDVDDPEIEAIRWQLLGTGWFDRVRLRLERGSRRGWVVLVVEVEERNTIVVEQLTLGISEGVNNTRDTSQDIVPYGGLSIAETNLLGLGMSLSATALFSKPQQAVRLRYADPMAFGSDFLLSTSVFFTNAKEFFGRSPLVSFPCDPTEVDCPDEEEVRRAVVLYRRAGLSIGTGHDLGASTRYTLDWQGEWVNVRAKPEAASERIPGTVRPIDFAIEEGTSWVSLIRMGLVYDRRNDPGLPTDGLFVRFLGDGATRLLGSDYDFLRLQGLFRYWVPLPHDDFVPHYLRFGAYAGVVFGEPPFFYKFHVSDMTDLIPSRVLLMELDSRPPPNLLNTSIAVMRAEEIAARVDVEYGVHLWRGEGALRAVSAYASVGLYSLLGFEDVEVAIPGYSGIARAPIDLTFDVGLRLDTDIGVFQFGFSNLLGFIAL